MIDWTEGGEPGSRRRLARLARAAALCLALNLVAALLLALFLRHGTTLEPLPHRAGWVASNLLLWRIGWGFWMAAALTLVWFYWSLAATLAQDMRIVNRCALLVGAAGLIPDLSAEILYSWVLPGLYAQIPSYGTPRVDVLQHTLKMEGIAELLTGALGNGLYTVAGVLLTFSAYATPGFPRALAWAALPAWLFGFGLSVASLLRSPSWMAAATAGVMTCFLAWVFAVRRTARRRAAAVET